MRISPQLDRLWPLLTWRSRSSSRLLHLGTPLLTAMYHCLFVNNLFHRRVTSARCSSCSSARRARRRVDVRRPTVSHNPARPPSRVAWPPFSYWSSRAVPTGFRRLVRGLNHKRAVVKCMGIAALFAAATLVLVRSGRNRTRPGHRLRCRPCSSCSSRSRCGYNPKHPHRCSIPRRHCRDRAQRAAATIAISRRVVHVVCQTRWCIASSTRGPACKSRLLPSDGRAAPPPGAILFTCSPTRAVRLRVDCARHLAVKLVVLSTNDHAIRS